MTVYIFAEDTDMPYLSFSLNGQWEMDYREEAYASSAEPIFSGAAIANAVPGYWEDMQEDFQLAPFFGQLKVNPEHGLQRYPIAGTAPDMALPYIVGNFFYRRTFRYEGDCQPCAFHFAGVQNELSLWLNGIYLGHHEGYSTPFEIAIPQEALLDGENTIVLSVSNCNLTGYDNQPVSGLTNRAANQYTGGITGDVSLRVYESALRDAAVRIYPNCTEAFVEVIHDGPCSVAWEVLDGPAVILQGNSNDSFSFPTDGMALWSPENPKLYTLRLRCGGASLVRSFGVRRLTAEGNHLHLNGVPYYLRGICEHCYYPETVHPNHDIGFYRNVIRKLKELGFNFIRFHTHIPAEEYMQAADELGILMEVESPNYTSEAEYRQIVDFCRRHTSVIMYCCGNELEMDDDYIVHMERCAAIVHENTDALFSPMSALRGVEYFWQADKKDEYITMTPFRHHPKRLETLNQFCDLYNSYTLAQTSYDSLRGDPAKIDSWDALYRKPRLSHEIGIQGTYTDLSLESRYAGSHIGKTDMFPSIRQHLASKGLLHKAHVFFRHSSQWQRRLRKHCFETTRMCKNLAGYDFLGPIDTHWHTFGYDVGMMNEFYELKPGETVRNVRMYNSATVLLTDLGTNFNFTAGEEMAFSIYTSHFGPEPLTNAQLNIRLTGNEKLIASRRITLDAVKNGEITRLHNFCAMMPQISEAMALKLYVTLECGDTYAENEWELYLFPEFQADSNDLVVLENADSETLLQALRSEKDVLLLGKLPFVTLPTSFQISLAGRTNGNLATVITDHPALSGVPHEGFCGWQFRHLLEGGSAVCFEDMSIPYDPIIEVASSHKYAIRQSILFEFNVMGRRLLVCGFSFKENDPAAQWLKAQLIRYAQTDSFAPVHTLDEAQLLKLINGTIVKAAENTNRAFNPNDKAAIRKKR